MKTQIAHAPGDNARDEARNRQEALGPEAVASTPAAASLNPSIRHRVVDASNRCGLDLLADSRSVQCH
jgi:hypothetical protein